MLPRLLKFRLLLCAFLLISTIAESKVKESCYLLFKKRVDQVFHYKEFRPDGLGWPKGKYFPKKEDALAAVLKDLGLPPDKQPDLVLAAPLTDAKGRSALTKPRREPDSEVATATEYVYELPDGTLIVVQDHGMGHKVRQVGDEFVVDPDPSHPLGFPHFNVRPITNIRTGAVTGTALHYVWGVGVR